MDMPHEAVLLRIFTSTADRCGLEPLHQAIVRKAREKNLAGATVVRGAIGFGQSAKTREEHLFSLSQNLPIIVEIVDSQEKIDAFLPVLDEIMESGLVTLEAAKVLQYGRHRAGLLKRIADYFTHGRA